MDRTHLHIPTHVGDKIADDVTNFFGMWACLFLHAIWFFLWFLFSLDVNLLTNIVSLEAIGLSILIMMSGRRSGAKDRARDDVEAQEVGELYQINKQQLAELDKLSSIEQKLDVILQNTEPKTRSKSTRPTNVHT